MVTPIRPTQGKAQAPGLMMGVRRRQRPRLTARILAFGLLDVIGMTAFAVGAMYAFAGHVPFLSGFPASLVQAWACMFVGVALMFYSAAQILRELLKQSPPVAGE